MYLSFGILFFLKFFSKPLMYILIAVLKPLAWTNTGQISLHRFSTFMVIFHKVPLILFLSFALSIVLEVGTKLRPFGNKDISKSLRFRLDIFTTLLHTKILCNLLSNIFAALSFTFNLLCTEFVFASRCNKLNYQV